MSMTPLPASTFHESREPAFWGGSVAATLAELQLKTRFSVSESWMVSTQRADWH